MIDYLPILYLISFSALLYRIASAKKLKELLPIALLSVLGIGLAMFEGTNALLFFSILIIFNLISLTYSSKSGFFLTLLGIAYLLLASQTIPISAISQAMLFGLVSEFWKLKFNTQSQKDKKVETKRDVVQIILGIIILFIFYFAKMSYAEFSIIMLIMLGYLTINYGAADKNSRLSKFMRNFERDYTKFGQGAAWLAIGALASIAFVFDTRYIMIIFFALFIGDALATIIGVRFGGYKLPYNKTKSIAGSVAYFASVSILPYVLYGTIALPLAVLATLVETLPVKLDDNFSVPLVLIVVYVLVELLIV